MTRSTRRHDTRQPQAEQPAVGQLILDNGLSVTWQEDHRQPLVALEARITGGLRAEGNFLGAGITHFIEHMLFKGTPTRPPGTIDQEVRRYGGSINAFTSHDSTGVSLFVESKYLREALELMADVLQHATFPPDEFAKERAVVISEIQMNRDDPERRLQHLFWHTHFLVHPYRHPILGYQDRLESLTVDDLRAFYRAQYVPNNIQLACVGDVDAHAFPQLVRDVFGSWPRGPAYQIVVPEEPPAITRKQASEILPIQTSYVMLGFPSTRLASPDLYPLDVVANVAGQGQSSRLYEELVRRRRVADIAGAANYTPMDPGVFTVYLRTDAAQVSAAVDAALEVLARLAREGISEAELRKAKAQVAADYVFSHQTVESIASDLANSLALTGDPTYSLRYVDGIASVTREQVREVAARYLDRTRMTLVTLKPEGAPSARPAPVEVSQPAVKKEVLPNGLTILTEEDHRLPMTVIVAASRGGVRVETEHTQGVSNLVAHMLLKGTKRRSATDIAAFAESRGADLEAFSGRDGFGLSLQALSEYFDESLALVHELLTESIVPEQELELQRQLILKELDARDDDIFDRGGRLLKQTLFTTHPYRFDPLGSKDTVQRLTRADCLTFAAKRLVPGNTVLAVFGDIQEAKVLAEIRRQFGSRSGADAEWPSELKAEPLQGVREASLTLPKEQSLILLGFRGTRITAPDRYAVDILTTVLSGMSGRLFQSVREQQGLAYTLGASNVPGWDNGYIVVFAATPPGERQQVLQTLAEQLQAITERGITEEELELAKRHLIGLHRLGLQSLDGLARRSALDELYGLGYDAWMAYERHISDVTVPIVQEAARHYLQLPNHAEVVIAPEPKGAGEPVHAVIPDLNGR